MKNSNLRDLTFIDRFLRAQEVQYGDLYNI